MGTDRRNPFLIVSGDKARVQKFTDVLNKNFANASVFHSAYWIEAKYKLANVHPKIILVDEYLFAGQD
jgi:CRP/FNR family cyclic AMP-dependent transcriptional regulator